MAAIPEKVENNFLIRTNSNEINSRHFDVISQSIWKSLSANFLVLGTTICAEDKTPSAITLYGSFQARHTSNQLNESGKQFQNYVYFLH